MRRADRRGFTLIELIAGLALVGVVLSSTILLIDGLRDGRDRLIERARLDNAASNGLELMRLLIARAETPGDVARRFYGAEDRVQFVSWCETPSGWLERCSASVAIERSADSSFVRADLSTGERLTLMTVIGDARFRYFVVTPGRVQWMPSWVSSSLLPSAVGLIIPRDTIVMMGGRRG